MSLKVSRLQRLLSYIYPVRLKQARGMNDVVIGLFLFRNEWQLATTDALYSDGSRYRPLIKAFNELETRLISVNSILVLGTGIGSAVMILNKKRSYPAFTLVDHDAVSLQWAIELFDEATLKRITPVHADAKEYMQENKVQYDVAIIDIFKEREVPEFVTEDAFLINCKNSVRKGGTIIINYIENDTGSWQRTNEKIGKIFPDKKVLQFDINRIVVATV